MRRYTYYVILLCFLGAIMTTPLLYFHYSDSVRFDKPFKTKNVNTYIPSNKVPIIKNIYEYYYTKNKYNYTILEILTEEDTKQVFTKDEINKFRDEIVTMLSIEDLFDKETLSEILKYLHQDSLIITKMQYDSTNIIQVQLFLEGQAETTFYIDEGTGKVIRMIYQINNLKVPDEKTLTALFTSYTRYANLDMAKDWTLHDMKYESYQLKAQIVYTIEHDSLVLSIQPLGYQQTSP